MGRELEYHDWIPGLLERIMEAVLDSSNPVDHCYSVKRPTGGTCGGDGHGLGSADWVSHTGCVPPRHSGLCHGLSSGAILEWSNGPSHF